jgi:hypothetical protein
MHAAIRKHLQTILQFAHSIQRQLFFCRCMARRLLQAALPRAGRPMVQTRASSRAADASLPAAASRLEEAARVQQHAPVSNKHAGCLVPLFEDGSGVLRVWLTRRSKSLRTHAGELRCLLFGPGRRMRVCLMVEAAHHLWGHTRLPSHAWRRAPRQRMQRGAVAPSCCRAPSRPPPPPPSSGTAAGPAIAGRTRASRSRPTGSICSDDGTDHTNIRKRR